MSLLCQEHWDLGKVNTQAVSEMGILTYVCLSPKSEFKASNSHISWF